MRSLDVFLGVLDEPGEVLAQLHGVEGEEHLVVVGKVVLLGLHVGVDGDTGGIAPLQRVIGVEEPLGPALDVVLAEDAGAVVVGGVEVGAETEGSVVADASFVLALGDGAPGIAVLAEAVGLVQLGSSEGVAALLGRSPQEHQPLGAE